MAGRDVKRRIGKTIHDVEGVERPPHIEKIRKRPSLLDIGVVMRGIGGEHQPASSRSYPHDLETHGVPADQMCRYSRSDLANTVVEFDASLVDPLDHFGHR